MYVIDRFWDSWERKHLIGMMTFLAQPVMLGYGINRFIVYVHARGRPCAIWTMVEKRDELAQDVVDLLRLNCFDQLSRFRR